MTGTHSIRLYAAFSLLFSSHAYTQSNSNVGVYSQADRAQALNRDVSFAEPQAYSPGQKSTSVVLNVVESVNAFNGIALRHRSYNGGLVGPTIRVRPGQVLNVTLRNMLRPELTGDHSDNTPHGFNTTNLHTHGLHVSPKSPADDVFREVAPGQSYQYRFEIPADHHPGTFWYHAHKHGSTALQLASGMGGALIVEGGLDELPAIRAATERVMVLQQFTYRELDGEPAYVDPALVYSGEGELVEAINGVVTPTIVMRPGEIQRWRIIHAGTTDAIFLDIEGVNFYEIAVDGLATGKMVAKDTLELYPGYRSDVLVQAPLRDGARLMNSWVADAKDSIRSVESEQRALLKLVVEGDPKPMDFPTTEELRKLAAFTQDDVPGDQEIANTRQIRFRVDGDRFLVNDELFDPDEILQKPNLNSSEEWEIVSDNGVHPFHIHVNPFATKLKGTDDPWVWRDTIVVRRRRPVLIRTRYERFTGKTVLHCHNLRHEDKGMMQAIEIVGTEAVPGEAENSSLRAMPRWSAHDSRDRVVSSEGFRGRPLLLVFHRGLSCVHCAEQLQTLNEHYDRFREVGLDVIAISQYLPDDQDALATIREFRFPVLVDDQLFSFKKFDCIGNDGVPLHGLFLIDREDRLVHEERSEVAEVDVQRLVNRFVSFASKLRGN